MPLQIRSVTAVTDSGRVPSIGRRRRRVLGTPRRPFRQDVIDGDRGELSAVDDHGDLLTGKEVVPGRVAGRSRGGRAPRPWP